MKVTKHDNGNYYVHEHYKGQRLRVSLGTTNLNEAKKKARKVVDEWQVQIDIVSEKGNANQRRITLIDCVDRWLDFRKSHVASGQIAERTYLSYKESADRMFQRGERMATKDDYGFADDLYLDEMTRDDPHYLLSYRVQEGYAAATIKLELQTLKSAIDWAKAQERFAMPADVDRWTWPKLTAFIRRRYFTVDEQKAVTDYLKAQAEAITAAKGNRWRMSAESFRNAAMLFDFLIATGLRRGEARALRWCDVDFATRKLSVFREKVKNKAGAHGKVGINDEALMILHYRKMAGAETPMFPNDDQLCRLLTRAFAETVNKDPVTNERHGLACVHSCRDTFVTRLQMAGMDMKAASTLVGHSGLYMTNKYSHLSTEELAERQIEFQNRNPVKND